MNKIGLGTWSFGGNEWLHGWGAQSEKTCEDVIIESLKSDICVIDTSPVYGLGKAETIIGKVLEKWSGKKPFIATKCGQAWSNENRFKVNLDPHFIEEDVKNSLLRLCSETIDLVFLHYPANDNDENLRALDTLFEMRERGIIKHIGVSNFNKVQLDLVVKYFDIYACQSKYSILEQDVEQSILEFCSLRDIEFYAYQPLESGLLTGSFFPYGKRLLKPDDWRSRSSNFKKEKLNKLNELFEVLSDIAEKNNVSMASIALAWVINNTKCSIALVGIRNLEQLSDIKATINVTLSNEDRSQLNRAVLKL